MQRGGGSLRVYGDSGVESCCSRGGCAWGSAWERAIPCTRRRCTGAACARAACVHVREQSSRSFLGRAALRACAAPVTSAVPLLGALSPKHGTKPLATGPPVWCQLCRAAPSTWHWALLAPAPKSHVCVTRAVRPGAAVGPGGRGGVREPAKPWAPGGAGDVCSYSLCGLKLSHHTHTRPRACTQSCPHTPAVRAAQELPLAVSAHVRPVPMSSVDSLCAPRRCAPLPLVPL